MAGTTNFPSAIDNYTDLVDNVDDVMADDLNNPRAAIMAIESKIGVDGSTDPSTLDYKLKNANSVNPGHKHTHSQTAVLPIEWSEDGGNPPPAAEPLVINNRTVRVRKFQGTTSNQDVTFAWQVPSNLQGTSVQARVIFFVTETTSFSNHGVYFSVALFSMGDGDSLNGTYGTAVGTWKTGITASRYKRLSTNWSNPIYTVAAGETLLIQLTRAQNSSYDTYNYPVGVFALELKYTEGDIG